MAKGSFSSNTGVQCNIRLEFWSSIDVLSNSSNVTMTAFLDYYAPLYMGSRNLSFNCNGNSYQISTNRINDSEKSLKHLNFGSWTTTVQHNSDGSKSCYLEVSILLNITYSGKYLGTVTAGGNVNLDKIPRKSIIESIGDFSVEGEHWLNYRKYFPSFWQNLWITAKNAGRDENWQTVGVFGGYENGQHVKFDPTNIAKIYSIAMPETTVGAYVDVMYHLETWTSKGGIFIGEDTKTVKGYLSGNISLNIDGNWKKCIPFVNDSGTWKPCFPYTNVLNNWKSVF